MTQFTHILYPCANSLCHIFSFLSKGVRTREGGGTALATDRIVDKTDRNINRMKGWIMKGSNCNGTN